MKVVLEFNYPDDEDNLKRFVQVVGNREWVGLTEAEFLEAAQMAEQGNYLVALHRIQTILKERNT